MMATIVTINAPPRRMLTAKEAAIYCGVPATKFQALCSCSPIKMPSGQNIYDIKDLDAWLDSLKTNAPDSDDAIVGRLAG